MENAETFGHNPAIDAAAILAHLYELFRQVFMVICICVG
tara:strand:- start:427 stop:543 length:117 start_codon:yes stop_codon:yes gene_type:complete